MYRWLVVLLLLSITAQASELEPLVFENQWGEGLALDSKTQLLIFSSHKAGGKWVKQALTELDALDIKEKNWLYVANIAGMPSLISKMFAIPKMRSYGFPIGLVKNDRIVASWPQQEGYVAIYQLENLSIKTVKYFNTVDGIKRYLRGNISPVVHLPN